MKFKQQDISSYIAFVRAFAIHSFHTKALFCYTCKWWWAWYAWKQAPRQRCTLQTLHPKYVSLLRPFSVQCLHLPRGLINFAQICLWILATLMISCLFIVERLLLEKSPISFSAMYRLKSTMEKCFVGFLVPGVSTHNRKALISEISKIKLTKYFQNFLEGRPTGFLDLYCCVRSTP